MDVVSWSVTNKQKCQLQATEVSYLREIWGRPRNRVRVIRVELRNSLLLLYD